MNIQEQIAVMQHYANGGKVEVCDKNNSNWRGCFNPSWDWRMSDYRIKKEPRKFLLIVDISGKYPTSQWAYNLSDKDKAERFMDILDKEAIWEIITVTEDV